MATSKEEPYRIKRFKNDNLSFWCGYLHYQILDGKLIFVAGGLETKESREKIEAFLKRNKIEFR